MTKKRKGFTLIELLVVIAILCLLIAILMPSLAKARDLAKQTSCLSNLRNLGTAFQLYTTEYGCFPLTQYYDSSHIGPYGFGNSWNIWFQGLEFVLNPNHRLDIRNGSPIVSAITRKLILCPSDVTGSTLYAGGANRPKSNTWSYGESVVLTAYDPNPPHSNTAGWYYTYLSPAVARSGIRQFNTDNYPQMDNIPYPSNTLELMGGINTVTYITYAHVLMNPDIYQQRYGGGTYSWVCNLYVRHPGGLTSNFVDGHAEARPKAAYNVGQFWGIDDPNCPFPNDQ